MAKYKLLIQKLHPVVYDITVQYEERTNEGAIVKAHEILKEEAELFSRGEYLGKLYKKSFLFGWQQISVPNLTCK